MIQIEKTVKEGLSDLKKAARSMSKISNDQINTVLKDLAQAAIDNTNAILKENQKDLDRMEKSNPKYDRLLLNPERLQSIAGDLINVANLPSPLRQTLEEKTLDNGLQLKKVSVPMGIIGIVFESRPNVTFDVFALSFKSGNAVALKGSRDAHYSNIIIVDIIKSILLKHNIPQVVMLAPSEREALKYILEADDTIDLIIPRGSQGLIDFVRENAKVPVIETGAGIVHTYIDATAEKAKAKAIVKNAKTRRVSVCNALDCMLVHKFLVSQIPDMVHGLDVSHDLVIHADAASYNVLSGKYRKDLLKHADAESYGTEFLSMQMSIKVVESIDEALDHIYQYSSKHSEAIISESPESIERFFNEVDAAAVYANTSTGFTDGAQFGLGAEIGISTQKLHARGPMALKELTSYKWIVKGDGQIRN